MGIYRTEEKGIPMTMVTATPPAGIANAGTSDNRNVLLSVRDVRKVYGSREAVTRALDDVSFDICEGEFVGVMGPSGSGKSTLLNCISTIDTVTSGNIILSGLDITQLRSRQLSKFRRDDLGFIFQDANLLDTLTGFENIALALFKEGRAWAESRGIIIADTKFEFGMVDGELILIDEVLTPDSSRFWPAEGYKAGQSQPSFDKQYLRDWLSGQPWDKTPPPPALPKEVVEATQNKYLEAYRILTGSELAL